jgi:hypothetical protein
VNPTGQATRDKNNIQPDVDAESNQLFDRRTFVTSKNLIATN